MELTSPPQNGNSNTPLINPEYFAFDKRLYFLWICVMACLVAYLNSEVMLTHNHYYEALGQKLSYQRIDEILASQEKWSWITYTAIPLVYLLKFFLITITLRIGAVLMEIEVSFKQIFRVVMIAEAVFILPMLLKLGWFMWITPEYTMAEYHEFQILSLMSLFNAEDIPTGLAYPLRIINLFEILYWIALAQGFSMVLKRNFRKMLGFVMSAYGTGLLIWIVLIIFLSVSLS